MQKIILLHGAIGSEEQLIPLKNELSDVFEVYTFNFSGHGGRSFEDDFSIVQFSKDLLVFLNDNKIEKTHIFGYSMGGFVALYSALVFPERIQKIITLGTKFEWSPEIAQREMGMLNPDKIQEKIPKFAEALQKRHQPNDWKEVLEKTAKMMFDLGQNNLLKAVDFSRINNSIKLMLGENDEMVSLSETKWVHENLPQSELKIIPNTFHPIEKVDIAVLKKEIVGVVL